MAWRDAVNEERQERQAAYEKKHGRFVKWGEGSEGQEVEGVFLGCEEYNGENGKQFSPKLRLASGEIIRLAGRQILVESLGEAPITDGQDEVQIKYLGKVAGKRYHAYRVSYRLAGSQEWIEVGGRGEDE